jgi:hypothetical protein
MSNGRVMFVKGSLGWRYDLLRALRFHLSGHSGAQRLRQFSELCDDMTWQMSEFLKPVDPAPERLLEALELLDAGSELRTRAGSLDV